MRSQPAVDGPCRRCSGGLPEGLVADFGSVAKFQNMGQRTCDKRRSLSQQVGIRA